jgi:hypothetical protein
LDRRNHCFLHSRHGLFGGAYEPISSRERQDNKIKRRYRAIFLSLTTIILCLTVWQSIRSRNSQSTTDDLLSSIQTQTRQLVGRLGNSPIKVEVVNPPMKSEQPIVKPSLNIFYHGQKLDGQTVTLAKSCIPASSIQPDMCIDNNYPDHFGIFGVGMLADKSVEATYVRLNFSNKVTIPPNDYCWRSNNLEGTDYGCSLNREIIPAQLLSAVLGFSGTPPPAPEMVVTMKVFYGSTVALATFKLKTPT